MTKSEFIRWYKSIRKPAYMNDLKLSEVWHEIYEIGYKDGYVHGKEEYKNEHA